MKLLRKILFWIHLVVGVATGLVVLLLCLTGTLLALELPITNWADRRTVTAPTEIHGPPAVEPLFVAAAEARGGQAPQSVKIGRDPRDPAVASWGRRDTLKLDPWTGQPGVGSDGLDGLFHTAMELHRWFALEDGARDTARLLTGGSSLLFVVLIPSGLVLWIPRPWSLRKVRKLLVPKRMAYGKGLEFQWHHALGLWSALPLLFFAFTGAAIGFHWLNDAVVGLFSSAEPTEQGPGRGRGGPGGGPPGGPGAQDTPQAAPPLEPRLIDLDAAVALATQDSPDWRWIRVSLPDDAQSPISLTVDSGNGRQVQRQETLTVDRAETGSLQLGARSGWDQTDGGRKARILVRFGHTGEYFGALGIVVAVLSTLAGAFLAYSGLALSLRRFLSWNKKRAAQKS